MSQDAAHCPGNKFYFSGDTIYSYGSHFPIARHVTNKRGSAVLLTTRGYSATTAGHKAVVARACQHLTVFHVDHVTRDTAEFHRAQFDSYRAQYVALALLYTKREPPSRAISPTFKPWSLRPMLSRTSLASASGYGCRILRKWLPSARQSKTVSKGAISVPNGRPT